VNTSHNVLERYQQATARLDALIEATPSPADSSRAAVQQRAGYRMGRLRRFLDRLGDPQLGYPIVHVGGTSGKGSTSTTIAAILHAAGYRTGLHTSPYLQTPLEKLQVDGQLVAPDHYADLVDRVIEAHGAWQATGEEPITYGEAWLALTALFFQSSRVDIAVLEVGAGGRFDLTNINDTVMSVITSVGIDHTNTLGETIPEIAWHKAGIIKPGRPAVTAVTGPDALAIIREEATRQGSPLREIDPDTGIADIETGPGGTTWTDRDSGRTWRMSLPGSFQARNGATAIAAIETLRSLGWSISDDAIVRGLEAARIPGRAELIDDTSPVLLDGAHNPQKVAALVADVPNLLPVSGGGQRVAVIGSLEAKQSREIVASLLPVTDALVTTAPRVLAKDARDAAAMAEIAREAGFTGPVWLEPDPVQAMETALRVAGEAPGSAVLVTGSLYLIGNVRQRWYAEDAIVLARSSWPVLEKRGKRKQERETP
jgi:dihydrofolate synthase/folylpolyglutamate synthase